MKIRLAYAEELDVLHGIVRKATHHMDDQGIPQWDEIYPNKDILSQDLNRQDMHIIEVKDQVAGFIVMNEGQSPEYASVQWLYPGQALVAHRLTIHPAYQRNGLATQIMDRSPQINFSDPALL